MLLIKPYLGCNLRCKYCYENAYRDKYKPKMDYNLKAILKRMDEFKNLDISLHGGEILTLPKKDIEILLAKSYELKGKSGIQTNATLIDNDFIKMFKKYKTSVGISWDGPGELSAYRPGTKKVGAIIERLVKEKISTSLIIVVSKANTGTKQRLDKLKKYLLKLKKLNIYGRINPCYGSPECKISIEKLKKVYLDLAKFCLENNLKWSPFTDIVNGLKGKDRVCTFMECDPFHTSSAMVVLNDGNLSNCMRTNQKGVLLRHPAKYNTRNEILKNVPQEYGGCEGCKYWTACFGGCPSGAIDNDWRNRTYLCPLWKTLFKFYEEILVNLNIPILPQRYSSQKNISQKSTDSGHGDSPHGDWADHKNLPDDKLGDSGHGDASHGDSPHGDWADHKNLPDDKHRDSPHKDSHGDWANEAGFIPKEKEHGDSPYNDSIKNKL